MARDPQQLVAQQLQWESLVQPEQGTEEPVREGTRQ